MEKMKDIRALVMVVPLLLFVSLFFFYSSTPMQEKAINGDVDGVDLPDEIVVDNRRMLRSALRLNTKRFAVVFDGGSTGTRVHVFCFDKSLNLLPIGDQISVSFKVSPGLSSYASDPEDAGTSLAPLLAKAENVVPKSYLSQTPLRLGATAGLRALDTSTAQKIIQAVRNFLKANTKLKYSEKYVTIIDGSTEGEFLWVSMNYLLGNLGKKYSNTVGVVDLGGGSVQMAYAISAKAAKNSPKTSDGEELYVKEYTYKGKTYHLYVHSYMNYGLNAAKVEILKAIGGAGNPCILKGYNGSFTYNEVVYQVSASNYGASYQKCRQGAIKALKVNTACPYKNCTFGGVWNGDGGYGQRNLYVASFFYDRAAQVGFINSSAPSAKVKPVAFAKAAKSICQMSLQEANSTLTKVYQDSIPFICMDLVYEYTLLTDGFGLDPYQEITLVTEVEYKSYKVGAAWALGGALDLISSSSSVSLL